MKRLFTTILLLVYFAVSTGFAVSVHYCMNRMNSAEIGAGHQEKCGKCGMEVEDSDGCCRSEVKIVKLDADQLLSKFVYQSLSLPAIREFQTAFLLFPLHNFSEQQAYTDGPPPLLSESDTWLNNRVFRL